MTATRGSGIRAGRYGGGRGQLRSPASPSAQVVEMGWGVREDSPGQTRERFLHERARRVRVGTEGTRSGTRRAPLGCRLTPHFTRRRVGQAFEPMPLLTRYSRRSGSRCRPAGALVLGLGLALAGGAPGANPGTHWAYVKPSRPALPSVRDTTWPRNPIDFFILARLEEQGLRPSPPADHRTLIRRVSLDLTGLPPTIAEVDRFVADQDPRAYEALVERLLAKPAFGEHWARMWLDLARYADSAGYADDPPRTIWAYRDWVIKAFNANMPFDRFTLEQIAGDLLDNADEETKVATAFHRNTMTNNEGGTSDEEFRNAAVIDRVNTTMSVWMATTMACAQCHNHKYDPITQKEYFRFFALFNNTADANRNDEAPVLDVSPPAAKEHRAKLRSEITELERAPKSATTNAPPQGVGGAGSASAPVARLQKLKAELEASKPVTVPVMSELPSGQRRTTHIQIRGNYLALAEEVTPGVPGGVPPAAEGCPAEPAHGRALAGGHE